MTSEEAITLAEEQIAEYARTSRNLTLSMIRRVSCVLRSDALRHLIAEARKVPQWQPWSTAPKDRTEILVACHHGYYVVRYAEDFHGRDIGAWVVDDNKHGPFPLRGTDPTHWMPLPSAPDAETKEADRG